MSYTKEQIADIVAKQRAFYNSGATLDLNLRKEYLKKLKKVLEKYEAEMIEAVKKDMGRADVEIFFMETFMNMEELDYALKHIDEWTKPKDVKTPLLFFMSDSDIYPEPYGISLIISAWNFPLLQLFSPLIGAVAAGNTAILKPAGDVVHCGAIANKIVSEVFPPEYVIVIEGKSELTTMILEERLDYVFFTGSPKVGRIIHAACSKNLVPCTLELGGKSPAIVDETADIDLAAKRIMWAKLFNSGQICVTADHAYVQKNVKEEFIAKCIEWAKKFYGEDASKSDDYGFMINDRNFDRVLSYMNSGKIVYGGGSDKSKRYIQPTIMTDVTEESMIMQDEIFGPILPVLEFENIDELIALQRSKEKPLALYYFSNNKKNIEKMIRLTSSGGVTINDCMVHGGTAYLPFGGVGNSGMGSYHGFKTFEVFSHMKAVMKAPTNYLLDLPLKYPPYAGKLNKIKKLERFL
jgi:aldehyde dehydrogenase (NAD+)